MTTLTRTSGGAKTSFDRLGRLSSSLSSQGGWNPITLQYEALRDIVVVLLHAVFFGLNIFLAVWWQNRYKETQTALPTSTYGRPLVKKA